MGSERVEPGRTRILDVAGGGWWPSVIIVERNRYPSFDSQVGARVIPEK